MDMSSSPEERSPIPPFAVPLGRLLIEHGLLTQQQLIEGLLEQDRTGDRLGTVLIRLGFVDGPSVAMALATQHGGPLKTEYGFATGFDPAVPTEPQMESPPSPDPAAARPLPSELRLADQPRPTTDGSPNGAEPAPPPEEDAVVPEQSAAASQIAVAFTGLHAVQAELDAAHARIADLERELVAVRGQLDDQRSQTAELDDKVASSRLAAETAIAALRGVTEAPA
jgi:hypothetical protein